MEQEELEFGGPAPIEELEQLGISAIDIKKLKDAGYGTIESICFTPRKALVLVKGLSDAKIDKILEAANSKINMSF